MAGRNGATIDNVAAPRTGTPGSRGRQPGRISGAWPVPFRPSVPAAAETREVEPAAALLAAARQAADNGRLEEASVLCDKVLAQDAASAEAHYLRGLVRQAGSHWSEAQRCFEKALYLQPRHYEALVHLMLLAERQGDQNAAANYRRRAQQVAPGGVP